MGSFRFSTSAAGPSHNDLPTSSIVEFSIPAASAAAQDTVLHISLSWRSELVRLLMSGPGTVHNTAAVTY